MHTEQILGRSAWRGADLTKRDFHATLSDAELTRIDALMARVREKDVLDITADDFSDDVIASFMAPVRTELRDGRGLVIVDGCGAGRYTRDEQAKIFWGLGTHIGVAETQSIFGDRIGHVQKTLVNPNDRGYRSDRELQLHCDSTDVAGLLCLQVARSGGISRFTSALAVHDEMLKTCPELLPPLYEGYFYHRSGEQLPQEPPITPYKVPVFAFRDGLVSCHYLRAFIDMAARELEPDGAVPEPLLTALTKLDEIATRADIMAEFYAEPGDMMFMNNHMILHARSSFTDHPEPDRRRHMLRLWLEVDDLRPIAPEMDVHGKGGIKAQPALVKEYVGAA
jgi:hypothetical protein